MNKFEEYKEAVVDSDFAYNVVEAYEKANAKIQEETGFGLSTHLGWAAVSYWNLRKARKHAKAGNYGGAIFYALIWLGVTRNADAAVAVKQRAKSFRKPLTGSFYK